ncbi:MAG: nitrate ABC transporter substrate-binding protein, partial [Candidatus Electrothrix sp. AR4]|nr:nitrate ABC transporter substrate-binding protein [Candidatus Electrothrix sp. AR4]
PSEFGVNFVANSVITSEKMLKEQPQVVEQFLSALLQGWEAAMNPANTTEVLAAVKKRDKNTDTAVMRKQLAATRELVVPASGKLGRVNVAAWKQTEAIMLRQGQIKRAVQVEKRLRLQ